MPISLFTKVMLGIGVLVIAAAAAVALTYSGFALIHQETHDAEDRAEALLDAARGMQVSAVSGGLAFQQFLMTREMRYRELTQRYGEQFTQYAKRFEENAPASGKEAARAVAMQHAEFRKLAEHLFAMGQSEADAAARAQTLQQQIIHTMETVIVPDTAREAALIRHSAEAYGLRMLAAISVMSLLLVLLSGSAGRYIYRSLVQPMRELARGAEVVAQGNLDHRIGVAGGSASTDEIANVARNFNHMLERLQLTTVSRTLHEHRENELRTLLDSIQDYAIFVTDADGYVTTWNLAGTRIFGYESDSMQGVSFARIFKEKETANALRDEALTQITSGGRFETDTRLMRKDGTEFDANVVVSPLTGVDGSMSGYSLVVRDITRRRNAQRHIEQLATRDPLTGLLNRGMLMEQMNLAIARAARAGSRFALMFVDLDNFKSVNDTLGHVAGDALLTTVASRLSDCVREVDIVARWGGDEFVVLLADVENAVSVTPVAERMLKTVTAPLNLLGHHAQTSASIGICVYPDDGTDTGALMKHADIAMYHAKEQQRNNFQFFAPEMNERVVRRLQLERELSTALQDNQFVLHYQPQISVESAAITGVEALLRWRHPQQGLLAPGAFIGLTEENGMIKPIGQWVMHEACRAIKRWRAQGTNIPYVVVNVSAAQLNAGLPELVREALVEHGIEPAWLMLEITETLLMENVEEIIDILQRIRELGIRIAMDDFGTGYSSLSVLQRLPLDTLKVDRGFINEIQDDGAHNERAAAIIGAIIAVAKELGLVVVAEGVETSTQLAFLRTLKCDTYQGYLFSKPIAEADLMALVSAPLRSVLADENGRAITMSTKLTMELPVQPANAPATPIADAGEKRA